MHRTLLAAVGLLAACQTSEALAPNSAMRTRQPSRLSSSTISCRLGDLSGDLSKRVDLQHGRICETNPTGKQVCRKVSRQALGVHDDLDADLAGTEDLPSWWILRAEESFRSDMQNGKLDQLE